MLRAAGNEFLGRTAQTLKAGGEKRRRAGMPLKRLLTG
jgi:hypothetical protein